ncbi:hypothetical protein, partial [Coleofasciculus sp. LEGE 07081]
MGVKQILITTILLYLSWSSVALARKELSDRRLTEGTSDKSDSGTVKNFVEPNNLKESTLPCFLKFAQKQPLPYCDFYLAQTNPDIPPGILEPTRPTLPSFPRQPP